MCNAIKWSFTAAYLVLLAMSTGGLLGAERAHFSSLLVSLGLPWTLFLDTLGEASSLIGVSPPRAHDARAGDQPGHPVLDLLDPAQTSNAVQWMMRAEERLSGDGGCPRIKAPRGS